MKEFNYIEAFSCNLGWVTEQELQQLRCQKVAIAGMGSVGGDHLINLTRLGISRFHISDMDAFKMVNFNRQTGASMSTIGQLKVFKLEDTAKDINPELEIKTFPEGINETNLEDFLDSVDLYVDSIDIFAVHIRRKIFDYCFRNYIPIISAASLGMGTSVICFNKSRIHPDEYFGWKDNQTLEEQVLRFLVGMSPLPNQLKYLVDPEKANLFKRKAPSTPMGIHLAAGTLGAIALKVLLGRGKVIEAPRTMHFDAYLNTYKVIWRPFGAKNPLQKITLRYVRKRLLGN